MQLRPVLYDGQAESRSADRLGVALVYPVEPLEDAALIRFWYTDSGILHTHDHMVGGRRDFHLYAPMFPVILDRIVTEIVNHFRYNSPDTGDVAVNAGKPDLYILLVRGCLYVADLL